MTKVEELREVAINVMRNMDVPSYPELVDSLIAAAEAIGFEKGVIVGVTEYKNRLEAELRR